MSTRRQFFCTAAERRASVPGYMTRMWRGCQFEVSCRVVPCGSGPRLLRASIGTSSIFDVFHRLTPNRRDALPDVQVIGCSARETIIYILCKIPSREMGRQTYNSNTVFFFVNGFSLLRAGLRKYNVAKIKGGRMKNNIAICHLRDAGRSAYWGRKPCKEKEIHL